MKSFAPSSRVAARRALLAAFAGLALSAPLAAQSTVTYTTGETNANAQSTDSSPLTLALDSGTATQSGAISGTGGIVKTGAGTLTLSGANTYAGATRIEAGTLTATSAALNNTDVQLAGGAWRVNANAQTISNAVTVSGQSGLTFGTGSNWINSTIGSTDSAAALTIAQGNGGSNTVTFFGSLENYGGTLILANKFYRLQGQTSGTFDVSSSRNALWQINTGAQLSFQAGSNTAYVIQLGGLQGAGNLSGGNTAGTGSIVYQIGNRGGATTFSGAIVDGLTKTALTKVGSGSLTLSGTNTYTGATAIDAGALVVDGSLGNSVVTVGSAGTLAGHGTLDGATTVNGALRPDSTPTDATSRLTFTGPLTLAATSETTFDIDGANYTGVTLSTPDSLGFGGGLNIDFLTGVSVGEYDLFAFSDATPGSFLSVNITDLGGLTANLLGTGRWGGALAGHAFEFNEATGNLIVSAIPEPASAAAILGALGLGLAASRRRRTA